MLLCDIYIIINYTENKMQCTIVVSETVSPDGFLRPYTIWEIEKSGEYVIYVSLNFDMTMVESAVRNRGMVITNPQVSRIMYNEEEVLN